MMNETEAWRRGHSWLRGYSDFQAGKARQPEVATYADSYERGYTYAEDNGRRPYDRFREEELERAPA